MDVRPALKSQYHAAFAMLRDPIEKCPADLWTRGNSARSFWRIAYHALFYGHMYLQADLGAFVPWEKDRDENSSLWAVFEPGKEPAPYTKEEILEYWDKCDQMVGPCIDSMNLESQTCGFDWYKMPKLDHQIVNIRHIQQHAGQLSELLMGIGIDTKWVGGDLKEPL